ncbi:MAG: DUF2442 domain-containing protein [Ignavibacteriota bacterium]
MKVTFVEPVRDYRLFIRFADGAEGTIDLSDIPRDGVFEQWSAPGFFQKVFIDPKTGTLAWPGEIDLDPYVLYSRATGQRIEEVLTIS